MHTFICSHFGNSPSYLISYNFSSWSTNEIIYYFLMLIMLRAFRLFDQIWTALGTGLKLFNFFYVNKQFVAINQNNSRESSQSRTTGWELLAQRICKSQQRLILINSFLFLGFFENTRF